MKLEILYKKHECIRESEYFKMFIEVSFFAHRNDHISFVDEADNDYGKRDLKDLLEVKLDGEQIYIDPEYEKEQVEKMRNGIKALVNIDKSLKSLFEELRDEYDEDE